MTHGELGVGLILFGLLAAGGTVQDAFRQMREQPDWVAMNGRSVLRGTLGWLIAAAMSLLVGIVLVAL